MMLTIAGMAGAFFAGLICGWMLGYSNGKLDVLDGETNE